MWNMKIWGPRGKVKLSIMSLPIRSSQFAASEQWKLLAGSHISLFVCKITSGYCGVVLRWALSTTCIGCKHLCCLPQFAINCSLWALDSISAVDYLIIFRLFYIFFKKKNTRLNKTKYLINCQYYKYKSR